MNSPVNFQDLRLSFIWTETVTEPKPDDKKSPLFRKSWVDYELLLEDLLLDASDTTYCLPWRMPVGQHFWTFYLQQKNLDRVRPETACRSLTPVRQKWNVKLAAPNFPGRIIHETYLYPFGFTFVLTAVFNGDLPMVEVVEELYKLKRGQSIQVKWKKNKIETLNLEIFAAKAMQAIKNKYLGKGARSWKQSIVPFSVVTFVRARMGNDKNGTPAVPACTKDNDIHRALTALTSWSPTWAADKLPDLSTSCVPIKSSSPAQHLLYSAKSGRVVWFPHLFLSDKKNIHSLGCYHRNLLIASMHVASLGTLIHAAAEKIKSGEGHMFSNLYAKCTRHAALILGRLYGNTEDTFRSFSPRLQMEQNHIARDLIDVRNFYNLGPLTK